LNKNVVDQFTTSRKPSETKSTVTAGLLS